MKTLGIIYKDKDGVFRKKPFTSADAFKAYRKFSEIAADKGIKVLIARPRWYSGRKLLFSWNLLEMKGESNVPVDFIFDRALSPDKEHLLFMKKLRRKISTETGIMNHPFIEEVCNDKYITYRMFKKYLPGTFTSLKELGKTRTQKVVIKPRYGAGGRGVRIIDRNMLKRLPKDFVLQEFIDTSAGIKGIFRGVHDLRCVVLDGKIVDFYVRAPRKGLVSNISLGGDMIRIRRIPSGIRKRVKYVDGKFAKFMPRFYSVDFLIDGNQVPWIVETNSKPTLDSYYIFGCEKEYEEICRRIIISLQRAL